MTKNVTDITLVTTTALNQCRKINPSNPQAVADQIEAMYQSLKDTRFMLQLTPMRELASEPWATKLLAVLNAIEGE